LKKSLVLSTLLLSISCLVVACSSTQTSTSSNTQQGTNSPQSGQSGDKVIFKIGTTASANTPVDKAMNQLKDTLDKKTNGHIKLEIYNNSQLGADRPMLDNMKVGALDMMVSGDDAFSITIPEYAGVSSPYLFKSIDKMNQVLHGPIGDELSQAFQKEVNSQVLDWWDRGARQLTANKEIKTPDDLKNIKIRVPEIPIILDTWRALGANPTAMSYDQVFNALSQKVIDAQENPLEQTYTAKFYEAQKYIMITDYTIEPWIVLMNDDSLKKLSAEEQKILKESVIEAGKSEGELVKKTDVEYTKKLKESGNIIVTDVDKTAFIQKVEQAHLEDKYKDKWKPGFLDKIREAQK
jgi:tripartite ATP-independent transporter DctP family solute receptor